MAQMQEDLDALENSSRKTSTSTEKPCTLWVHNEAFSKESVLFNAAFLPLDAARNHQLLEVKPIESGVGVRDFETSVVDDGEHTKSSSASSTFLFVAKDVTAELKAKYPGLQVSVIRFYCLIS